MGDAKIRYVAKKLAEVFTDDTTPEVRACACLGTACGNLDCSLFWEMFLSGPDKRLMETAIQMINIAKRDLGR